MTFPQFSGVVPHLAQVGSLGPPRSECGVGCLMPWSGKLYVLSYNSHKRDSGHGLSLRRVHADMSMEIVPETLGIDGTYTNRFVHFPSNQIVIGPHVIDADHRIRTVKELEPLRICGTTWHLTDPNNKVFVLCMEGEVFELNVRTLECVQVFDLQKELGTAGEHKVHFKDCYSCFGKLVVCSNEYFEEDWRRDQSEGRLAEYDGKEWRIIEKKPFIGFGGRSWFAPTMFSNGWDQASAILQVYTHNNKKWTRYRLPKASHTFDHKWQTEWPRIREVEHERFLLDHHGMFYELSPWAYGNRVWGIKPISTHLWVLGDFCSWRGMLVMGADNASPSHGLNPTTAEPQSGLWFGKTDDLWNFGKPMGWGGPWWEEPVQANVPSDPYLMTSFDNKCVHISHDLKRPIAFDLELDFAGHGKFHRYATIETNSDGYAAMVLPPGLSAHWARLVPRVDCLATAQFHYT
jgi:hypothetical protein